jgi:7-carboxy-7-deazaguanine synthase
MCYGAKRVIGADELLITEIFHSLQGETTLAGVPFAFIRLTGCNLRCAYCDTAYAFKGGTKLRISEILEKIRPWKVRHVLLTGGEPLLQRNTSALLDALRAEGYQVSIETHGELPLERFAGRARLIMDIKTPSSGMSRGGFRANLKWLGPQDEIKFVIASQSDYFWARELIQNDELPRGNEILFSPVMATAGAPGSVEGVEPAWLAARILEDRLPVRMQIQLHKIIWGANQRGV